MARTLTPAEITRVRERARLAADILTDALDAVDPSRDLDQFDDDTRQRLTWIAKAHAYAHLAAYLNWYPERPRSTR